MIKPGVYYIIEAKFNYYVCDFADRKGLTRNMIDAQLFRSLQSAKSAKTRIDKLDYMDLSKCKFIEVAINL